MFSDADELGRIIRAMWTRLYCNPVCFELDGKPLHYLTDASGSNGCKIALSRMTHTVQFQAAGDLLCPHPRWNFGIARSVRMSVSWRCCLGYRHAGCLQLSHRRPPEMCGLRPRTDVDPPRVLDPWTDADGLNGGETICHSRTAIGGAISSRRPRGDTLFT